MDENHRFLNEFLVLLEHGEISVLTVLTFGVEP